MKICASNTITRLSLGIAFVLGSAIGAEAATIAAYTITGNRDIFPGFAPPEDDEFTTGIQLEVFDTIDVTALGVYRVGFDNSPTQPDLGLVTPSLAAPRTVTLWDVATETAIISSTISDTTPGSFLSPDEYFRYLNLPTPVTLNPGLYRLSTFIDTTVGDNDLFEFGNIAFGNTSLVNASPDPNGVQLNGNGYPRDLVGGLYNVSANIIFDDGTNGGGPTVPEPSLIGGLLLFGLGGLLQKLNQNH